MEIWFSILNSSLRDAHQPPTIHPRSAQEIQLQCIAFSVLRDSIQSSNKTCSQLVRPHINIWRRLERVYSSPAQCQWFGRWSVDNTELYLVFNICRWYLESWLPLFGLYTLIYNGPDDGSWYIWGSTSEFGWLLCIPWPDLERQSGLVCRSYIGTWWPQKQCRVRAVYRCNIVSI